MTHIGIEQNSPTLPELITIEPARAILKGVVEIFPDILEKLKNWGGEDQ